MKPSLTLLAILLAVGGSAAAQQAATPNQAAQPQRAPAQAQAQQLTPQQQAALTKQNQEMTAAARQVTQLVDSNRIGEVWDGGSAVLKRTVTRDEFIKQVTIDRNRLGKPASRGAASVGRAQYPAGARVPEGLYINVATPTRFANAQQPVPELVSFRLDEDRTWRVSGYSLRVPSAR